MIRLKLIRSGTYISRSKVCLVRVSYVKSAKKFRLRSAPGKRGTVVSVKFFMQTGPKFCYVYYLKSNNKLRTIEPRLNIYIDVILFIYI